MFNPSEPRKLVALQRELQVLGYRKAGLTYRQIASHMNITRSAAFKAEMRALKRMDARTCEAAKQLRILERMRLAEMMYQLGPALEKGNRAAIDQALKIQDRVARLIGVYGHSKESGEKECMVSSAAKHTLGRLEAQTREEANQLRESELTRLGERAYQLWPAIERGDCAAISRAIKIIDREARLYGLY